MRPVNLIPGTQRRGDQAPLRAGQLSYALIAGLVLVLGAVIALVLTGNKISDHKSELATLQAREQVAEQHAAELAPYTDFANLQQTRQATVAALAQSRFDWERVLRELSLVIPGNVWLTSLSGSVTNDSSGTSGGSTASSLSAGVTGPSLSIVGCATSQRAVASFLASLRNIDGVTRVGLQSSVRSAPEGEQGGSASGGGGDCTGTRPLESFEALAAFDAVPTPAIGTDASAEPGTVSAAGTTSTAPTTTAPTTSTAPAAPTTSTAPTTAPAPTTSNTSAPGGSN